jgi:hypothetical protein
MASTESEYRSSLNVSEEFAEQILFRLGFSLILFILANRQVKKRIDDKAISNILS